MKNIFLISVLLIITNNLFTGCQYQKSPDKEKSADMQSPAISTELSGDQLVKQGEYLVTIMGCSDCHSPKDVGPQGFTLKTDLMLSGYPADRKLQKIDAGVIKQGWVLFNDDLTASAGPWGVSFSANLTSDQTGIGNWTEENFKRAMKEGKYKGLPNSRMLLPPMPWQNFAVIQDKEIDAIFAYLKSTRPVSNVPPPPVAPQN